MQLFTCCWWQTSYLLSYNPYSYTDKSNKQPLSLRSHLPLTLMTSTMCFITWCFFVTCLLGNDIWLPVNISFFWRLPFLNLESMHLHYLCGSHFFHVPLSFGECFQAFMPPFMKGLSLTKGANAKQIVQYRDSFLSQLIACGWFRLFCWKLLV